MNKIILILSFFITSLFSNDIYKIDSNVKKFLTTSEINYIKNKKTIIASSEFDYEPMDFTLAGVPTGYSIDLLNILTKSLGLKVEYKTMPWTKLLESLHNGEIDLMHTLYKNKNREKFFDFSYAYLVGENVYIVRKESEHINKVEDLFGKKVAVTKGWLEELFLNKYPQIEKVYFKDLKQKLNALSIGEVDAVLNDKNIANYYMKKYGYSNLKISNQVIQNDDKELDKYYFAALKEESILISILNKAYINLDIKTLEKIQEKWFGSKKESQLIFTINEQNYLDTKEKIKMCILPGLTTFSDIKNNKATGIVSDILKEIENNTNLSFDIVESKNFNETFNNLEDKKCDVLPTVEYSEKNNENFLLTQPFLEIPYVAIGKSNKDFFSDLSELEGKKISVIAYTSLIKELKQNHPSIEIVGVNSIEEGLNLVKTGEVYIHLTLYPIAKFQIAKQSYDDLKIIGRLLKPLQISMASQKDDTVLASILQKTIKTLSPTKLNSIVNNWTAVKVEKVFDYNFIFQILAGMSLLIALGFWRFLVLKRTNKEIKRINFLLSKSKKQLKKQKDEFEAIFRYSKDGIGILDLDLNILDLNLAYLNILSYPKEELLGRNFLDFIIDKQKENMRRIFKKVMQKGHFNNFEKSFIGKDNKIITINLSITLLSDRNRILITAKDVTSVKLLESQSKLASIGEMIGNIAHQWRQPLSIITTSASGMALKVDLKQEIKDEEIQDFSEQIIKQADYLSKTIDDFRNFIKVDVHKQAVSVKDALGSALGLTIASIKGNYIEVVKQYESDLTIKGNKNELSQAFINIINNAKDKLKELNQNDSKRYLFISTKKIEENAIEIKILDNGGGIDENIIKRVFEPYFTTKDQSVGTGLGLSMSDKIIRERHQGIIEAKNEEFTYMGEKYFGAAFVIVLYKRK
ncbi:transporter substrate-binding domain-containing protein [Halarcobacter sp.]|uniref:transporter substrate-binding domain-containing protein n=1 Tax=Halarcobacter sp. TaxID=2321133 RepID=UPI0029F4B340|nr:transporter substrate-binding domain-containing protein [Halarcobacter sp.]